MAVLTVTLALVLAACTPPPAFDCCGPWGGKRSYPVIPAYDVPVEDIHRDAVRSAIAAGVIPPDVDVDAVARSARKHAASRAFWDRMFAVSEDYARVAAVSQESGRDPFLAAWPYLISEYTNDAQAPDCARGAWELAIDDPRVDLGPCRLRDSTEPWVRGIDDRPIVVDGRCRIHACSPDPREDAVEAARIVLSSGELPDVDRDVAAGVHLLAVCVVPMAGERPPHCARVRPPPRE